MNRKRSGVTLIEIIIAMLITAVIVMSISFVINAGMDSWFFMKEQNKMMASARNAMQRMQREIKRTASVESITVFSSTEYEFVDVDNNTINYQKNAADLERNGLILLKNLAVSDGLEFIYLDKDGVVATTKEAIQTVQLTIKLSQGTNQIALRSAASIRNR